MSDKGGVGVTVISHDSESRTSVDGYEAGNPTLATYTTKERTSLS